MVPYSYTPQECCIWFADEVFDVLKAKTNNAPILPSDVHAMVRDLRRFLDVVGTAASNPACPKGDLAFHKQLCRWQEEVDWRRFYDFMTTRAKELPYPSYLCRAHTHGSPIPRFRDDMTGDFCDSFGSDMHIISEDEGQSEIFIAMSTPSDSVGIIEGLVEEVAYHLKKTQINANRLRRGEAPYFSQMVSLSGDLLWTTHTACQKGRIAGEDQVAGLAFFQTSKIRKSGGQVWRVKDLLEFFDSNPKFQSSKIDSFARTWAANADEYLCWDLVPKEALINFVPFTNLVQQDDEPEDVLLRSVFLSSKDLGVFRRLPLETLTVDQYQNRISNFMMEIMDHIALEVDAESFVNAMVESFRNPSRWGYILTPGGEDLETMLRRVINIECAWGVSLWGDSHPELWYVSEKIYNDRIKAASTAIVPAQTALSNIGRDGALSKPNKRRGGAKTSH